MNAPLISDEQFAAIHKLQGQAIRQDNQAVYWALSLALDFALSISADNAREQDIARVERALRREVQP